MPESSPQPSTGVEPSAEAKAAAAARCALWSNHWRDPENGPFDGDEMDYLLGMADRMLIAAYAIDTPAIHAAGVAEGRAAAYDEMLEGLNMCSWHREREEGCRICFPKLSALIEEHQRVARAAMRDEIVEWLRHGLVGVDSCSPDAIANGIVQKWADAIEAAFPTTGEKTDG